MFWKKKPKTTVLEKYDREKEMPVIRVSICTGEQVAGFKDRRTGQFREILCIRTPEDQRQFLERYGLLQEEVRREY